MLRKILIAVLVGLILNIAAIAAEENNNAVSGMSYPMQKSMDPEVWSKMMGMMMDPAKAMSMENCALCHQADDLARYAEDFGPMMDASQKMAESMSPHQMMQMATPMMNPMMGMMNPMAMMNPMMSMMYPMMGMMGPMMGGMMNPMMMSGMMNPMMMGGMMNPMMMGGGSHGNPMGQMMNPMMGGNNANPMGQMMKPEQYTEWFNQMMGSFTPAESSDK